MSSVIIDGRNAKGERVSASLDHFLWEIVCASFQSPADARHWVREQLAVQDETKGASATIRNQCLLRITKPSLLNRALGDTESRTNEVRAEKESETERNDSRKALKESISWRLRSARKALGIKAKELAARMNIRESALGQMELGRQAIPAELLVEWCSELSEPLQYIALGIDEGIAAMPMRHARLFTGLNPQQRHLVLEHLELVTRFSR